MTIEVSAAILLSVDHPEFDTKKKTCEFYLNDRRSPDEVGIDINPDRYSHDALAALASAAEAGGDGKLARALRAVLRANEGVFDEPIPNFKPFASLLIRFLKHNLIDGWLYVTGPDGRLYPELVQSISFHKGDKRNRTVDEVRVGTIAYTSGEKSKAMHVNTRVHTFVPSDVTRKKISTALAERGLYKETEELKADYTASHTRYLDIIKNAFAKQFRLSGKALRNLSVSRYASFAPYSRRKVIHDIAPEEYSAVQLAADSVLIEGDGQGRVPEHSIVRAFDLETHDYLWVHGDALTPYEYDKSLGDKLILPSSHRDLLDVLTSELDAFIEDFIEGKSAGNVILCKGKPGLGKTLTGEVYAELIERPLYRIHSGVFGTTPEQINNSLKQTFARAQRWQCVLLFDEADVFVLQRQNNVVQNAIVAEFLRALEYFDGLLFMTTNRPDDIDEAILSRCAAIIHYGTPSEANLRKVWQKMCELNKFDLAPSLLDELIKMFPEICPRDIKHLLRLVLRMAAKRNTTPDIALFRQCAMFRNITIKADEPH